NPIRSTGQRDSSAPSMRGRSQRSSTATRSSTRAASPRCSRPIRSRSSTTMKPSACSRNGAVSARAGGACAPRFRHRRKMRTPSSARSPRPRAQRYNQYTSPRDATVSSVCRGGATPRAALPAQAQDAYFQLVAYPVLASAAVQEMYVAAGRNRLYGLQGRVDAAREAERAREWFATDERLAREYHALKDGKWNHMMAQINIGYTYWQQPELEVMPAVSEIHPRSGPSPAMAIDGSETAWPSYGAKPAVLPPLDTLTRGSRWIELFNRGDAPYEYRITSDQPWLIVDRASGTIEKTTRVNVTANWNAVPKGTNTATLSIETDAGEQLAARIDVVNPEHALPRGFRGFLESDGVVAIEAPHYARAINDGKVRWTTLPDFGRTLGGVTIAPVTAAERAPAGSTPRLEYDVFMQSSGEVEIDLHVAPSLDFQSGEGLRIAVSIDDAAPQVLKLDTWANENWDRAVAENIRRLRSTHTIGSPGKHTVKVWMVTPGVVLQRVIVDAGGMRPSYLGPPESVRVGVGVATE